LAIGLQQTIKITKLHKPKLSKRGQPLSSKIWCLSNYNDALQTHVQLSTNWETPVPKQTTMQHCQTLVKSGNANGATNNAYLITFNSVMFPLKSSASIRNIDEQSYTTNNMRYI
jgi:hypothetical protein